MANTKIPVELSSTPGIVDGSNATAITIDSSENVGIGTTSPTDVLTVAGNITISDGSPEVTFQTGASHYNWQLAAQESTNSAFEIAVGSADADASNDSFSALMTVLQSGNVGIGTTSPTRPLTVAGSMNLTGTGTYIFGGDNEILAGQDSGGYYFATGNSQDVNKTIYIGDNASSINFHTGNSESVRIDSSGNLCLGTTSAFSGSILSVRSRFSDTSGFTVQMFSANDAEQFSIRGDGALFVGTDGNSPYSNTTGDSANAVLLSNGVLARSTSSQRYKKDIADATWGLTEVKQLRPVTFKSNRTGEFASDKTHGGLIAEEVHALGLTEFVDYNDSNEPDALHYGNMVALLTKAIQEQQTLIETQQTTINDLKSRIETLEG